MEIASPIGRLEESIFVTCKRRKFNRISAPVRLEENLAKQQREMGERKKLNREEKQLSGAV